MLQEAYPKPGSEGVRVWDCKGAGCEDAGMKLLGVVVWKLKVQACSNGGKLQALTLSP